MTKRIMGELSSAESSTNLNELIRKSFGLTKNEVSVFLEILNGGSFTVSQLSHITGIHRTRVYDTLKSLVIKQLIRAVSSNPLAYASLSLDEIINSKLDSLRSNYETDVREIFTLSRILNEYQSNPTISSNVDASLIKLDGNLTIFQAMLATAKDRVWVCKKTAGGIFDWFKLNHDLERLTRSGVDVRFISNRPMNLGFDVAFRKAAPFSFSLIDSHVISLIRLSPEEVGYAFVTQDSDYVTYLSQVFLDLWNSNPED